MAIAMKTGELEQAILRVKDGKWAWGYIFARVVLGFLYENPILTSDMGAIIPMPAYVEPGEDPREKDHARWVIQQAAEQDERGLPFVYDPPIIIKRRPTRKMRLANAAERREIAPEIYNALDVPDVRRVSGREIVVYDDVVTGGNTLNVVARKLKEAGAHAVYGLALSRAQWRY